MSSHTDLDESVLHPIVSLIKASGISMHICVYANKMQAKEIIIILTFLWFSGKVVTHHINRM